MMIYSLGFIIWSAVEIPHIKKDYARKGVIVYVTMMLINVGLLLVYLSDMEWPSFYQFWSSILNILGIGGLNPS